ncbi:MAG: sigma factor-like helix-turn-helix DNA-binding protein [Planctomycetota bacterium]
MERGRVDNEDLPSLYFGRQLTNALLDNTALLTPRQQEVVQLYYREALQQKEIAAMLHVTQQAVNDSLQRARMTVGRHLMNH